MSEAKTFNQAFEANLAFEEKVREELVGLQEETPKSWDDLVENLKIDLHAGTEAPKAKSRRPEESDKAKTAPFAKKRKQPEQLRADRSARRQACHYVS